MAIVTKISRSRLTTHAKHSEVDCTYDVLTMESGERFLQIDTYGSAHRRIRGKKSQSLRFGKQGLQQLKAILADNDL